MRDWGFDFIRFPMAYPRYISFDRKNPLKAEDVCNFDNRAIAEVDRLVERAVKCGLHVSLNLHRAPGFCINAGFREPFNLWNDESAQDAFYSHWEMWAKRYREIPVKMLSFDLVNEPAYIDDMNNQFAAKIRVPDDIYRKVAEGAAKAIRKHSPGRMIVADGNNIGNDVVTGISDLNIAQSCRGYYPNYVSCYQASWVWKDISQAPMPLWPGTIDGREFSKGNLEEFYKPWIELSKSGTGVHCGECGCYSKTPHDVFMAWFGDVLDILTENGIGYALWNFRGDFGILDSGRKDVKYTDWYGHKLDSRLLDLLKRH